MMRSSHRDPNSGPHQVDVEWPEFDEAQRQYLVFGPDTAVTEQDEDMQERFYWWSYVFPELTVPRSSRLRLHSLASIRKSACLFCKTAQQQNCHATTDQLIREMNNMQQKREKTQFMFRANM